jgi:hypothetical protein
MTGKRDGWPYGESMHQTQVVTARQYSNDLRQVIEQRGDPRFADTLRRRLHVTAAALTCAEISSHRARFQPQASGVLPATEALSDH